ncbi:OsmC family peroxiredoxin [Ectothiorhodospiraceae bacterium BW-2]|nr:OsmC family peroxiredoxin [Ectothiorhodospiraceae bacterium BW-2]
MQATIEWQQKMTFRASDERGHSLILDAPAMVGGDDNGFRPKQLLLDALGGCTAMDVISILTKMGQVPKQFRVEVSAQEASEHPKELSHFHLHYIVSGEVAEEKLKRAIELSQQRYCPVSAMFGRFTTISYDISYQ